MPPESPAPAEPSSRSSPARSVAGGATIHLSPRDMDGVWKLSFSTFGWKDYDSRGAILRIENGDVFGGGSNFVYRGRCEARDSEVRIDLNVDRYRADDNFGPATGMRETDHFELHCIADAITPDHFEGRLGDRGRATLNVLPDLTMVLMRFGKL